MTTSASLARAFWTVAPGRGEIRDETLPARGAGDVLVRTLYSGISRGTEALVFQARVPPDQYERMRAESVRSTSNQATAPTRQPANTGRIDLQGMSCCYPANRQLALEDVALYL